MTTETTYRIDKRDMDNFMRECGSEMVLAWLSGNHIDTQTVCGILKVSPRTLTNWIQAGRLIVVNEGKKSHEFDFSDVVRLFLIKNNKLKK
ncbi:MAG: hypothetical protein LBV41_03010 [Cytophagaceae bacterium]|jgi:hypothetical protein|nr:hypothetical protein [Cytophagaceae bacterium]